MIACMHDLVFRADKVYNTGRQQKYFVGKRYEVISELFSLFSKGARVVKHTALVHGFKTPNAEFYHKMLCSMILPSVDRLVFLYCIRSIKDCFLSLSAMSWFNSTPEEFIDRYIKSLKTSIAIKRQTKKENSKTNIRPLHLDEFIGVEDKASWLKTKLFGAVGVELSLVQAKEYFETTDNRNATIRATGSRRETELDADTSKIFQAKMKSINSVIAEFNDVCEATLASL